MSKKYSVGDVSFELSEGFIRKVGGVWVLVLERESGFFRGALAESGSFEVGDLPEWLLKFDARTYSYSDPK